MAERPGRRRRTAGPAQGLRRCPLAAFVLASLCVLPSQLPASPFTPRHDGVVVERLPASPGPRPVAVLGADAGDLEQALAVARSYIEIGRAQADPRYYGRAAGILRPWWELDAPPLEVRLLRAVVRQSNHDFDAALADLDAVLEDDPRNAQAWLSRAMILRARGAPADAGESCSRLDGLVEPLLTGACLASTGRPGATLHDDHRLLATLVERSASSPAVHRQWALTVLAELAARLGDADAAEAHLRAALASGGRSVAVLSDLADLLLERGDARAARELLRGESAADGLLLRLALAERALGEPSWREHAATLQARFEANRARGAGAIHLREQARAALYLFDDTAAALDLALRNWQVQRESWDARLVLAAALAIGRSRAAHAVLGWIERERFVDRRLAVLAARVVES